VKKFLIALLVLACVLIALRWLRREPPEGRLLVDRLWVDHLPKNETDPVNLLVAVADEKMGVFQKTSRWKGEHELFRFERRGDGRLVLVYPQTRDREEVRYRATRCDRAGFDYCLELRGASRGARTYVSKKGWEIRSRAEAAQKLEALAP
jgi:hypothetical protein